MKTYLISYDLGGPELRNDYSVLVTKIKSLGLGWAKVLQSVWLIRTNHEKEYIMTHLRSVVDINDKIIIMEVTKDWMSLNLLKEVTGWMHNNI